MSKLTRYDRRLLAKNPAGIVGVDEAGRGCLAGPVCAGAVWLDASFFESRARIRFANRANDSKQLPPALRTELHDALCAWEREGAVRIAHAFGSVLEINALNILGATRRAMHRCIQTLADNHRAATGHACPFASSASGGGDVPLFADGAENVPLVLVDGRPLKPFEWRHTALVGGDGRSLAIALASIVAKVRRDQLMAELDARYPLYGFAVHKGYATPTHIAALVQHGACPEHRPLFLRGILARNAAEPVDAQIEFAF